MFPLSGYPGWKNKAGTGQRDCSCGSWKYHWLNISGKNWPPICSVKGCLNPATLGGHIINTSVHGEYIVPICDSCNKRFDTFSLKNGVEFVSANVAETCGKK